jgi:hypothetical protein
MQNTNATKNLVGARTQNANTPHNTGKRRGTKFIVDATHMAAPARE